MKKNNFTENKVKLFTLLYLTLKVKLNKVKK